MWQTTQHWQSVGPNVGPVLIGQTGKKNTLYILIHYPCTSKRSL